jgi:septum formation topological specificity factor MinE
MALGNKRAFSAAAGSLQSRLAELVPQRREELAEVTSKYGDSSVGEVSVNQVRSLVSTLF